MQICLPHFCAFFSPCFPEPQHVSVRTARLASGMAVLFDVATQLASERHCYALAAHLLEGSQGGGQGFIKRRTSANTSIDWGLVAHSVLIHWCEEFPEQSTPERLCHVLQCKVQGAQPAVRVLAEQFGENVLAEVRSTPFFAHVRPEMVCEEKGKKPYVFTLRSLIH